MVDLDERQIVVLGGGGFSMEPDNPLLDEFIISLSRRQPARVCFIPTASGDSSTYIAKFYRAFARKCIATDLTTFDWPALPRHPRTTAELDAFVAEQDVFFVGGGNTANMLAIWRTHGLDVLLGQAWQNGAVLSGISAGMLCWFQGGLSESLGTYEPLSDGLALLDGSACPHFDGEPGRRPAFHRYIAAGERAGYAADDGAALHFKGKELVEVVSSRAEAAGYRVELRDGVVAETRLPTRFLGGP